MGNSPESFGLPDLSAIVDLPEVPGWALVLGGMGLGVGICTAFWFFVMRDTGTWIAPEDQRWANGAPVWKRAD